MKRKNSKVSVSLATYNEKETIGEMVTSLYKTIAPPLEVIVVDDASPDHTAEIVEGLDFPDLILIRRKCRGLASAFNRGIIESSGDIICWLDADLCMPVTTLCEMIDLLDHHHMVIGSRYAKGGSENREFLRVISSGFINGFARIMLGTGIKDLDSGFIAIRREVLNHISLIPFGHGEYFIELVYDAWKTGLRIHEVGFAFKSRKAGKSKSRPTLWVFFKKGAHYIFRIIRLRARAKITSQNRRSGLG